jgi:hypothetical protein
MKSAPHLGLLLLLTCAFASQSLAQENDDWWKFSNDKPKSSDKHPSKGERTTSTEYSISLDPITITVDEGTFLFRNLTLTNNGYLGTELNGEVVNNTTKEWSQVGFRLEGLDRSGNKIENAFDILNEVKLYSFKKGEAQALGSAHFGKSLNGFDRNPPARIHISFAGGEYYAKYTISMVKPKPSSDLTYQDNFIHIGFVISKRQIAFILENETESPIKIDWNQVSYIDIAKGTHKVMHEGVKYISRAEPQPPSTIPPTANLKDIVFPIDYVSYSSSRYSSGWIEEPFFPEAPRAKNYKGANFSIFMPLEINGTTKNYLFTFKIEDVQM